MKHFLLVLFSVLTTILVLIQAQDQSGFISIDCGLPAHLNYSALDTGINYISDAKFIDTGVTKRITPTNNNIKQELEYLRSFPSGVRNCYKINVTSGTKYLIRATFLYGSYDGLDKPPQFDLHFGPNVVATVRFSNHTSHFTYREIIYTPSQDYIQPCFVNTGNGTPFISVIELRTLNNTAYVTYPANSVLSFWKRSDVGSITNLQYRYKDDVYDRIWFPWDLPSDLRRLSTSLNKTDLNQSSYKPPEIVMSTAVTPVNASAPIQFQWDANNVNDRFYLYMHFNEVEELAENETREFNITVNDKFLYGPVTPYTTIFSTKPLTGAPRYHVSLSKKDNSTLPPILNAFEVYKQRDFSISETQQDDVDTMTNIKNAYGVARNWQGDPCAPVNYMWEGLNCSSDGNNIPRITSLNLSSSGLTGEISSSISKLTMLQYLDLSNNSLNGPLPDFLMQLRSLKILNVGKNKLTGLVPSELLERSKTGSLSLSVDDNPDLCMTESCKKKNIIVPLVASFSALVVIIFISFGFWIFRRQKGTSQIT
ncbi:putative transferase [Medicago truncatula]|uniref:Putative transferase n=1 Tax=Medicago truncatula TaxID=3880 RepID=A0A396GC97_MEDTR|nr:putative transferase [Medicago truncatula]